MARSKQTPATKSTIANSDTVADASGVKKVDKKKGSKKSIETYSVYIYRVLK